MSVNSSARPVKQSDGRVYLSYELVVTNAVSPGLTLDSLRVIDDADNSVVTTMNASMIAEKMHRPGSSGSEKRLEASQTAYILIDLIFEDLSQVPPVLLHSITLRPDETNIVLKEVMEETGAPLKVDMRPAVEIAPPLMGKNWVVVAVSPEMYHRSAMLPVNGVWYLSQRHAVDYVKINDENTMVEGDATLNESYVQYGEPLLAVADAYVVSIRDNLPDQTPGRFPESTLEEADGNSVVLDLGNGVFAMYAHLIPGSLEVSEGDRVKRGQILGLLGNSGNSDAPHLHFQLMDSPLPLAANGIPHVISSFENPRIITDAPGDFLENPAERVNLVPAPPPDRRTREMPSELWVIDFSGSH